MQSEDNVLNGGGVEVSIVGSPSAGTTENISSEISIGGTDDATEVNDDEGQETLAATGGPLSDDETDVERDSSSGEETIGITNNSTVTSIDPATGLQTVDTENDSGRINIDDDDTDTWSDDYTEGQPNQAPGGEDDLTDDSDDEEQVGGNEKSTETIVVTGTVEDPTAGPTTVNSTETLGSNVVVHADTDDKTQSTGVDLESIDDDPTSETGETTEETSDDAEDTDTETESLQATISTTDPTTGLAVTFAVQDTSGDTTTDSDTGDGTDVGIDTTLFSNPDIAPTDTGTGTESGSDDDR